jgi:hypothetical protein
MNAQSYVGQPEAIMGDQAVLTAPVCDPVTTGGWYECRDGSWARFAWVGGRLTLMKVTPEPPPLQGFNPVDENGHYDHAAHWDFYDSMDQMEGEGR